MLAWNPLYRTWRVTSQALPVLARYQLLDLGDRLALARAEPEHWHANHERAADALAGLADELGGVFVKLCQVLGTLAHVSPAPFTRKLARFHDSVPSRPFAKLAPHVERELGRPLARVFREIDETPLASASLAQVHRARLRGGAEVVLKIQYPEAWLLFQVDLGASRALLRSLSAVRGTRHLRGLVDEAARLIARELDFEHEARATVRLRRLLRDAPVRVPRVHRGHSSGRLLVLEYLPGTRVTDLEGLAARGVAPREVAARVAELYGTMLFEHGFFQGDPHPGNLLVLDDGHLGLLDFGCARELPVRFGADLGAMLAHGLGRNWPESVAAARRLGFAFRGDPQPAFERLLHAVVGAASRVDGTPLAGSGLDEAFYWLDDASFERIPPELTLVGRVLMQLTGLSEMLAPGERLIPILLAGHLARAARRAD